MTVKIETTLSSLEKADESMMEWMQNYKNPSKLRGEKTHEEIMTYLNDEKAKISNVKILMENSIKDGEALLSSIEN